MLRAKLSLLLLAVLSLASSHRLYAFDDWQPINPDELKMTADAAHQGDAIILYHEETADDMTRHRYVYKRLKVLTEKGKDRASVEIPYDAKYLITSWMRQPSRFLRRFRWKIYLKCSRSELIIQSTPWHIQRRETP
jgi:hypothetical protein